MDIRIGGTRESLRESSDTSECLGQIAHNKWGENSNIESGGWKGEIWAAAIRAWTRLCCKLHSQHICYICKDLLKIVCIQFYTNVELLYI